MNTAVFIVLALAVLAGAAMWTSLERVRDGQIAVLRRFGRSSKVLTPGLHMVFPLVDRVERRFDTIGRSVELKDHVVDRPDGSGWQVDGRVYYQIVDARQAAPELAHLEETVTAELDRLLPDFMPAHRDESSDVFNSALKQSLNARLRLRGIMVARTHIQAA
jgi:regulator of protease activity HflC (stomatin/prohibitin superfamily)